MDDADFQKLVDSLDDQDRQQLKTVIQYVAQCFDVDAPYTGILIVGNHETREAMTISMAMDVKETLGLLSYSIEKLADELEEHLFIPKEKKH